MFSMTHKFMKSHQRTKCSALLSVPSSYWCCFLQFALMRGALLSSRQTWNNSESAYWQVRVRLLSSIFSAVSQLQPSYLSVLTRKCWFWILLPCHTISSNLHIFLIFPGIVAKDCIDLSLMSLGPDDVGKSISRRSTFGELLIASFFWANGSDKACVLLCGLWIKENVLMNNLRGNRLWLLLEITTGDDRGTEWCKQRGRICSSASLWHDEGGNGSGLSTSVH